MPITLDGTNGITTPMYNGSITANAVTPVTGFKNRIINGDMRIAQRGTSFTPANNDYTLDRWQGQLTQSSKYTVAQSSTAPAGYINSLLVTSSSAYSVAAGDYFGVLQPIEGLNCTDLAWGTANAKTVTLSFQVYSSLTGTFGGTIFNNASSRSYPFSYTVSSANTWTSISVTIAGDTSGAWLTTNSRGLIVWFGLGAGSTYSGTANTWANTWYAQPTGTVSVVGTNGATFYITGVQLEVGSTATSFDYRSIGTETSLCQRYYWQQGGGSYTRFGGGIAIGRSSTIAMTALFFPVAMRAFPTVSSTNLGNTSINGTNASSTAVDSGEFSTNYFNGPLRLLVNLPSGLTAGTSYEWESNNNTTTRVTYSSEL